MTAKRTRKRAQDSPAASHPASVPAELEQHEPLAAGTAPGVLELLAAPFDLAEIHFKPAVVSGNRALAMPYVDARCIQDRLDDVLGVAGWQDTYKCLPDGSVMCRLRLRLGREWITKVDVGSPSEQPEAGDRLKAAFSDSLKRAAVKFGIGRYLYRLPRQWVDYDQQRKQFRQQPTLPPWALPPGQADAALAAACVRQGLAQQQPPANPPAAPGQQDEDQQHYQDAYTEPGPTKLELISQVNTLIALSSHRSWRTILQTFDVDVPGYFQDPDPTKPVPPLVARQIHQLVKDGRLRVIREKLEHVMQQRNQGTLPLTGGL